MYSIDTDNSLHLKLLRNHLPQINPEADEKTILELAEQAEDVYFTAIEPLFGSLLAAQKREFICLAIAKQLLEAYRCGWQDLEWKESRRRLDDSQKATAGMLKALLATQPGMSNTEVALALTLGRDGAEDPVDIVLQARDADSN